MIKQVWIAQCDICGKEAKARMRTQYNEQEAILPDGWKCGHNVQVHYCEDCGKKLRMANEEGE